LFFVHTLSAKFCHVNQLNKGSSLTYWMTQKSLKQVPDNEMNHKSVKTKTIRKVLKCKESIYLFRWKDSKDVLKLLLIRLKVDTPWSWAGYKVAANKIVFGLYLVRLDLALLHTTTLYVVHLPICNDVWTGLRDVSVYYPHLRH